MITVIQTQTGYVFGMEPWAASPVYIEQLEIAARQAGKAIIDKALLKLKPLEGKVAKITSEVVEGPPTETIVETAEDWGANLIVMGSRGLGTWNRLLLGSVSSGVVHHAKCSVEIVKRQFNTARAA